MNKLDDSGLRERDATRPWGSSDRAGGYAPANTESSGCAPNIRQK